ncbi:MAG: DUF4349 domain-containing protein [Planctomycetes bacterium]|nr:DUF4349 domain-containing protein [Planctomycetota bacterium]
MRRLLTWAWVVGCSLALSGCGMGPLGATEQHFGLSYGGPSGAGGIAAQAVNRPDLDPERRERLVVYNGAIWLVVQRIAESLDQVTRGVEALGGYMQELTANSITLRVPAAKFHDAIAMVEKLGEVTKKEIKGADVTEQVRDLRIRLQNAEQLRQRLLKLLEKSEKVEETLKVEQELARVTENIELLKGKLQYVETQVALSTLTVHLNSALPQREIAMPVPFGWIQELGYDLTRGGDETSPGLPFWRGVKLRLPEAYVKYYESDDETRALSADQVMVRLQRHPNFKGGRLDFWAAIAQRALLEAAAFTVQEKLDLTLRTGVPARLFVASKQIGKKPYGYLLAVVAREHRVYTFEAWGPQERFAADRAKLDAAIRSLRVGPLWRLLLTLL